MTTSYIGRYWVGVGAGPSDSNDSDDESELCIKGLSQKITNFISLEGSIAAGKSTFLKHVRSYIEQGRMDATNESHLDEGDSEKDYYLVVDEPVDEWNDPIHDDPKNPGEKVSMLQLFYRNPSEMGFGFQCYTFTSRLRRLQRELRRIVKTSYPRRIHVISERSLRGDRLFLAAVMDTNPGVHSIVHQLFIYNGFHATVCSSLLRVHNIILYIPTNYNNCSNRIKKRDRKGEEGISDDYLLALDKRHQGMIAEFEGVVVVLEKLGNNLSDQEVEQEVYSKMDSLCLMRK
jgi:deoxyadenosine/deoxycytidine kinase